MRQTLETIWQDLRYGLANDEEDARLHRHRRNVTRSWASAPTPRFSASSMRCC